MARKGRRKRSAKELRAIFAKLKYQTTTSRRRVKNATIASPTLKRLKKVPSQDRSEAAMKSWDTRTRKEGIQQATEGVLDLTHPAISTALATKDVVIGSAKIAFPRKIRKSKALKKMRII